MTGNEIKKAVKSGGWITVFLIGLLFAECLFIINLNLFHIRGAVDEDFAGMLRHTMEIARNGRLMLPNWFYPTTGEFDTSLFLAAAICRVCGNVYISFAIVNILNAALLGYVFARLGRIAGMKWDYVLMSLCMLFGAYDFGMVRYVNMLFFGGSQYVYKAVLPLLFLIVIYSPLKGFGQMKTGLKVRTVIEYLLFYGLFFLTSFSSGIYVFFVGLAPILITLYIIRIFNDSTDRMSLNINAAAAFVVAVIGVILNNKYDLQMHSFNKDLMKLRHDTTLSESFNNVLDRFCEVINPVRDDVVDAMTVQGVGSGIKWLILILICLGLVFVPRIFGIYLVKRDKGKSSVRDNVTACLISVFLWNFFIMLITVSKSRYHLIGFLPLMICACIFIEDLVRSNGMLQKVFFVAFLGMYAVFEYTVIAYFAPSYFNHEHLKSYVMEDELCGTIQGTAESYGVDNVVFVNVVEEPEVMRIYDPDRNYTTYKAKEDVLYNYDYYIPDSDSGWENERNLIFVTDEGYGTLKEGFLDGYEKIDRIGDFDVLVR